MQHIQRDQLDLEFQRRQKFRKHVVTIDSSLRDIQKYPSPTTYCMNLPTTYKQIRKVRLLTAEIPCSFYIFTYSKKNTTLNIGVYNSTNTSKLALQKITIPDGNYDINSMASTIQIGRAHV